MASEFPDTQILGGLLGTSRDRADRLRTLRFVQDRDPSGRSHAELVRVFCRVELQITTDKIGTLKQKSAKERHVQAAMEVMIEAGATENAADLLRAAEALLEKTRNPTPLPTVEVDASRDHLTIGEQDVLLLQGRPSGRPPDFRDLVFGVFDSMRNQRAAGAEWLAFGDEDRRHVSGTSLWISISRSTPPPVVDALQAMLDVNGLDTEREMGRARHLDLTPFARLSDDGLEILVPAEIAGDPTRKRIVDRRGPTLFARGYHLQAARPSLF
jgi:hypothetical protein